MSQFGPNKRIHTNRRPAFQFDSPFVMTLHSFSATWSLPASSAHRLQRSGTNPPMVVDSRRAHAAPPAGFGLAPKFLSRLLFAHRRLAAVAEPTLGLNTTTTDHPRIPLCRSEWLQNAPIELGRRLAAHHPFRSFTAEVDTCARFGTTRVRFRRRER